MKILKTLFLFAALILCANGLAPAIAWATPTHFDMRIPASACRPGLSSDADKVHLSNGTWVFTSTGSGSVTLHCPLHVAYPNDLTPSNGINVMRLWYRDPDATNFPSRVTARLKRREFDDAVSSNVGGLLSSDNFSDTTFVRNGISISHTADFIEYHVDVVIHRQNTSTTSPVFVGIDFAPPFTSP